MWFNFVMSDSLTNGDICYRVIVCNLLTMRIKVLLSPPLNILTYPVPPTIRQDRTTDTLLFEKVRRPK